MTRNILIIDDNADDLEFYADLFREISNDIVVHSAKNAAEGLALFKANDIFCTFIDYYLPEENGVKILEQLNGLSRGKVLPVVIFTGSPSQTIQVEAARKGALDYIVKDSANTPQQLAAVMNKTVEWADELNKKAFAAG